MKKFIALAAVVLVSMATTTMYAQESRAEKRADRKAQRDAERARLKAEEQAQDAISYDDAMAALGSVNVFSVASNGKPVLVNFLEALLVVVVQEIKSAQTAAQIKLEEKVEKYTAPVIAHQHIAQPAVNVAELSDEDKRLCSGSY